METNENAKVDENLFDDIISNIITASFFLFLIIYFFYALIYYMDNKNIILVNFSIFFGDVTILITPTQRNICWIFDDNVKYQALLSLGSVVMNNPKQKFNFYFILPPGMTIDLNPFNQLINENSKIIVRNYEQKHAYLSIHSRMNCKWPGIIIVKLWLYEILPELDEVLYFDTDVMNIAPLNQLWEYNITNKAFAAVTKFEADSFYWINSGVILYNLKELRKKDKSLWYCANKHSCFIDDEWHTGCHPRDSVFPLPLRYNIEMTYIKKPSVTNLHEEEKKKICLVHLKDTSQEFYSIKTKYQIPNLKVVENHPLAIEIMERLFKIKQKIDSIVHL